MGRSKLLAGVILFALGCVPAVDESGRACPCASGYVCCPATNMCMLQGSTCAPDASVAPSVDASVDASVRDSAPDHAAIPDAAPPAIDAAPIDAAHDAAPACGNVPEPVIHFAFDDCDDRGVYRDRAGGLIGVRQGPGVRCAHGPHGPAIAFDQSDAGSYVRVMDSADAGERICTQGCRPVPQQFKDALTVSVVLNVKGPQHFAHILGQWFVNDAYMLWTENDGNGQKMEFSVQPTLVDAGANLVTVFSPDTWIHWVAVYGGGHVRLYRDGALQIEQTLAQALPLQCTDVPLELGQIGRHGACGGDIDYAFFEGAMGDLRLYDVALDEAQVKALHCDLERM